VPKPAPAPRPRGPYAKSARIQAEVIEKAMAAFAERGFTGTSMREIALAVGMTQQGLSHHFPSKEALLEAVLTRRDEISVEHYRSLGLSVPDTLRAIVRDNVGKAGLVQLSTMLSAEAISPNHPAHAFFQQHWVAARSVFAGLLVRGQEDGTIRDDLPAAELATLLVGVFEGLQVQWLSGPDVDIVASFETAIQVLQPVAEPRRRARRGPRSGP
jgi:AcrR family transcriptional regulator